MDHKTSRLIGAIVRNLTPDLLQPKYQGSENPLAGHCAVATESLFHLLGGQKSGYVPQNIRHEGMSHWYLKHRNTNEILDPTAGQFATPVPYHLGRGRGFPTTKQGQDVPPPSRRAKILIDRVQNHLTPVLLVKAESSAISIPLSNIWKLHRWGHPITPSRLDYQMQNLDTSPPIAVRVGTSYEAGMEDYVHSLDPQDEHEAFDSSSVKLDPSHPRYFVSDGHHRLQAAYLRGDTHIKAIVLPAAVPHYLKGQAKDKYQQELDATPVKKSIPGLVAGMALALAPGQKGPVAAAPSWYQAPKDTTGIKFPTSPQPDYVQNFMAGTTPKWTPEGLMDAMIPIAHLESSFGLNMDHAVGPKGPFDTAHGAVGLKPSTAHEQYLKTPGLKRNFPGLEDPASFVLRMKNDHRFYNTVASAHFLTLIKKHGDIERAVFAWRHGSGACRKADAHTIRHDPYVLRYRLVAASLGIQAKQAQMAQQQPMAKAEGAPEDQHDHIAHMLKLDNPVERRIALKMAGAQAHHLRMGLKDEDPTVREVAASHLNLPNELMSEVLASGDDHLIHHIMRRMDLNEDNLRVMAHYLPEHSEYILKHPACTESIRQSLARPSGDIEPESFEVPEPDPDFKDEVQSWLKKSDDPTEDEIRALQLKKFGQAITALKRSIGATKTKRMTDATWRKFLESARNLGYRWNTQSDTQPFVQAAEPLFHKLFDTLEAAQDSMVNTDDAVLASQSMMYVMSSAFPSGALPPAVAERVAEGVVRHCLKTGTLPEQYFNLSDKGVKSALSAKLPDFLANPAYLESLTQKIDSDVISSYAVTFLEAAKAGNKHAAKLAVLHSALNGGWQGDMEKFLSNIKGSDFNEMDAQDAGGLFSMVVDAIGDRDLWEKVPKKALAEFLPNRNVLAQSSASAQKRMIGLIRSFPPNSQAELARAVNDHNETEVQNGGSYIPLPPSCPVFSTFPDIAEKYAANALANDRTTDLIKHIKYGTMGHLLSPQDWEKIWTSADEDKRLELLTAKGVPEDFKDRIKQEHLREIATSQLDPEETARKWDALGLDTPDNFKVLEDPQGAFGEDVYKKAGAWLHPSIKPKDLADFLMAGDLDYLHRIPGMGYSGMTGGLLAKLTDVLRAKDPAEYDHVYANAPKNVRGLMTNNPRLFPIPKDLVPQALDKFWKTLELYEGRTYSTQQAVQEAAQALLGLDADSIRSWYQKADAIMKDPTAKQAHKTMLETLMDDVVSQNKNVPPDVAHDVLESLTRGDGWNSFAVQRMLRLGTIPKEDVARIFTDTDLAKKIGESAMRNFQTMAVQYAPTAPLIPKDIALEILKTGKVPLARKNGTETVDSLAELCKHPELTTEDCNELWEHALKTDDTRLGWSVLNPNADHEAMKAILANRPEDQYTANVLRERLDNHLKVREEKAMESAPYHEQIKRAIAERKVKYKASSSKVKLGTGKLRLVRDMIDESGQKALHPKKLPAGDWSKFRDKNGNIDRDLVQAGIDSAPFVPIHTSMGVWDGAQRHNDEDSTVLHVNVSQEQVEEMKRLGVYGHFVEAYNKFMSTSHPHDKGAMTYGWVRYTPGEDASGPEDTDNVKPFIDEVQTDIGQKYRAWALDNVPAEHVQTINRILYGGKHTGEFLHEAWLEHMRTNGGGVGKTYAIHDTLPKAHLSGLDLDDDLPAHFQESYHEIPKKMGLTPGLYSNTQDPSQARMEILRGPEGTAWEGKVRKAEWDEYGLEVMNKAEPEPQPVDWNFDAAALKKMAASLKEAYDTRSSQIENWANAIGSLITGMVDKIAASKDHATAKAKMKRMDFDIKPVLEVLRPAEYRRVFGRNSYLTETRMGARVFVNAMPNLKEALSKATLEAASRGHVEDALQAARIGAIKGLAKKIMEVAPEGSLDSVGIALISLLPLDAKATFLEKAKPRGTAMLAALLRGRETDETPENVVAIRNAVQKHATKPDGTIDPTLFENVTFGRGYFPERYLTQAIADAVPGAPQEILASLPLHFDPEWAQAQAKRLANEGQWGAVHSAAINNAWWMTPELLHHLYHSTANHTEDGLLLGLTGQHLKGQDRLKIDLAVHSNAPPAIREAAFNSAKERLQNTDLNRLEDVYKELAPYWTKKEREELAAVAAEKNKGEIDYARVMNHPSFATMDLTPEQRGKCIDRAIKHNSMLSLSGRTDWTSDEITRILKGMTAQRLSSSQATVEFLEMPNANKEHGKLVWDKVSEGRSKHQAMLDLADLGPMDSKLDNLPSEFFQTAFEAVLTNKLGLNDRLQFTARPGIFRPDVKPFGFSVLEHLAGQASYPGRDSMNEDWLVSQGRWGRNPAITPEIVETIARRPGGRVPALDVIHKALNNPTLPSDTIAKMLDVGKSMPFEDRSANFNDIAPNSAALLSRTDLDSFAQIVGPHLPPHTAIPTREEMLREHLNSGRSFRYIRLMPSDIDFLSREDGGDRGWARDAQDTELNLRPEITAKWLDLLDNHRSVPLYFVGNRKSWTPELAQRAKKSQSRILADVRNDIPNFEATAEQTGRLSFSTTSNTPDSTHTVKMGTSKLRQVRDIIKASGRKALSPKALPPGDWSKFRDKGGNIDADLIQDYIDQLPGVQVHVSDGREWHGGQRHSHAASKVTLVNISAQQEEALRKAGAWQSFKLLHSTLVHSDHPHDTHRMSYGWLRWTANPTPTQPDGSLNPFIEEIQTDFGQHLDEKANVLNIPTDHVKTIREVLFGDKDPGEFLHEAWKEFQRKEGRLVPYSMFHATAKAPISLGSVIKDIPVHMQETYNAIPKTMGMKDSTYHKDQDVKEAAYHHLQVSSDATPVKTIVGRVEKKAVERNNLRKTAVYTLTGKGMVRL